MLRVLHPLLWTTLPVLLIDQLTKWLVVTGVMPRGEVIPGVLQLSYIYNTGAAFGIFRGGNIGFAIITVFATGLIGFYYLRFRNQLAVTAALGFLLGGAWGNLVDRIMRKAVVDFIDFRYWPAFNVADVAICVGAGVLALHLFRHRDEEAMSY